MLAIRAISPSQTEHIPSLVTLLQDAVDGGASIGFLSPLSSHDVRDYWNGVFSALGDYLMLWGVEEEGELIGTIQLSLCAKQNGSHRGEIQKLFVRTSHRGKGVATLLMAEAEAAAKARGIRLLVLDTEVGSAAEFVYRRLGWLRVGEIPDYAVTPDGRLHPTVYYYKLLGK